LGDRQPLRLCMIPPLARSAVSHFPFSTYARNPLLSVVTQNHILVWTWDPCIIQQIIFKMSVQQEQVGLMSAAEGTTRRPPISTSPASHSAAAPNLNTQHVRAMPSPRDATPLLSVPLSHPLAGQPEGAGIGDRPPHRGTTSSTATPGSSRQSPTPPKKPAAVKRQRGWWWWEIGACLLSIISTTLLFVLLTRVADSTLESWPYQIQINSVIATLTAVSRTALLVPIAACISQLKWGHFERPNRLSHLQDFDDASRGPWGSLLLLFKINLREYLVWALSLCTVLSLGIGPSAQQILDFPSRRVLLLNATAEMAQAPAYAAKEPFTSMSTSPGFFSYIQMLALILSVSPTT